MSGLMLGRSSLWKASTRFLRAATASTRTCPGTEHQGHSAAVASTATVPRSSPASLRVPKDSLTAIHWTCLIGLFMRAFP